MINEETVKLIRNLYMRADFRDEHGDMIDTEPYAQAVDMVIEALENCPPREAICYGCHENCHQCESLAMMMV